MSYIGAQPTTAAFVTDQFSGDGSTTVFTMSVAPANSASVIVAVSGVLQDPSTYAVSGTSLTFSGAPPAGSGNISARYLGIPASGVATTAYRTLTEFTATSGQTTFAVPSYTVGFINVYRNGVMLGTADFTATSGTTVVLAAGATAGDLVATESFYVSGVSNAIPAVAGAVNTSYITDGAVTDAKLGPYIPQKGVPAFRAYIGTSQTGITTGTWTKAAFNTETFDTNSNYDTTNYRFQPTVAGYYLLGWTLDMGGVAFNIALTQIFKNGVGYSRGSGVSVSQAEFYGTGTAIVYLNGTSDYVELYGYMAIPSGTGIFYSSSVASTFHGTLVRAD